MGAFIAGIGEAIAGVAAATPVGVMIIVVVVIAGGVTYYIVTRE